MYGYDPRYPPPNGFQSAPFSELDDPQFWADIAAQTGIPPISYSQIGEEEGLLRQHLPLSLPYPRITIVTPIDIRGNALLPSHVYPSHPVSELHQQRIAPMPVPEPPPQPEKAKASNMLWIALVCIAFAILLPSVLTARPQTHTMVRLSQLDERQYNSPKDARVWGPSACSAASMTEVLNYYGRNYRIADVLSVESSLGEISPELGMLNGESSIRRTVAHFGFKATALTAPALDEVIATANQGKPVIVSFPPATWAGGHLLVVRGGNATTVYLVDSSSLNMHEMSYAKFTSYWRGFAVIVEPA